MAAKRARVRIEGLLGEPPAGGGLAEGPSLAHLEAADALAREHLGEEAGLEGQIRRAVGGGPLGGPGGAVKGGRGATEEGLAEVYRRGEEQGRGFRPRWVPEKGPDARGFRA